MKKKFSKLEIVLFIIVFIVFLFSLYQVVTITLEYKAGRDEYNTLENFVQMEETEIPAAAEPTEGTKETLAAETGATTESAEEEIVMRYHDGFVNMAVDFTALEDINSDFEAWLYVPGASISYPIVLGSDNDYYLTHTFKHEENKAGAIFLDQVTANPFEDYNTIVHGHNMKDGSMFGRLKMFYNDTKVYANNPYFYVYTPEKTYKYLIFSYYVTSDTSDTYVIPNTEEAYQEYKERLLANATYKDVEGIPESAPIVTLSTCYGTNYTEFRLVVHGILVATQ